MSGLDTVADRRRALGTYGERLAERYLREQGLQIVERNWRCEIGEIDLVARDGDCLVVCEVKTRTGTTQGEPVEAVNWEKAMRLRRLAAAYARAHSSSSKLRVDVIGILCLPGDQVRLKHVVAVGS